MKKLLIAGTLFVASVLSPLSSAWAAILFVGGEDSDFIEYGNVSTASGYYNSAYARESVFTTPSTVEPPVNYFLSPTFASQSTIWVHAYLSVNYNDASSNIDLIRVFSPDGIARIVVRGTGTVGQFKISTNNSSNALTDLASMTSACFPSGSLSAYIDLYINYGTSGEVSLYCNQALAADYTGNVTTNSASQLNRFSLANSDNSSACAGGCGDYFSEVIASTSDTRNMHVVTMHPNANGNTHTWDTAAASNVNETTLNLTTVDASGTSGEIDEYTTQSNPLPTAGDWTVYDVRVAGQFQVDTTGPQHVQAMVRTGGTDFSSSNLSPPQATWGYIYNDWTTNPNTGVAWTVSDLNSSGFNIGFNSQN